MKSQPQLTGSKSSKTSAIFSLTLCLSLSRVPMHPGKYQIYFPGPGNVLEFYKINKCRKKILHVKKIDLEQKTCE